MITKDNPSMNSAAEAIYLSSADQNVIEQCRIREDAIAHEKYQNELIENLTNENASLTNKNASLVNEVEALRRLLKEHGIEE